VKEEGEEATVARGEPFFILRLIISDCKLSATTNERLLLVSPFLSLSLSLSLSPFSHAFPFLLFLKMSRWNIAILFPYPRPREIKLRKIPPSPVIPSVSHKSLGI